jgi:uncharacterized protein YndB with AHSA1/START domain
MTTNSPPAQLRTVTLTRDFDAPRALVYQMFTDPAHFRRWHGPKGYTCPVCEMDVRVGGVYLNAMRAPDGQDIWSTGRYLEVVPNERLVMTDSFADAQGNVVPATHYGMPADFPLEMRVTMTFADLPDGKTRFTLEHAGLPAGDMADGAAVGWAESFDKLVAGLSGRYPLMVLLPSEREIVLMRVVDAPRALVFQIYTDPAAIPHWWGPRRLTTTVDVMDVRPGGRWRYVQRGPDGSEHGFRGEYREIAPPERLVQTFEWEGLPGHISVETTQFEEHAGQTRVITTSVFATAADRDGMIQSGMESGAAELWDRLEEYAQSQAQ